MHGCPVNLPDGGRCDVQVDDARLMDAPHWRMVPPALQKAVYRAFDNGHGIGSPALTAAQLAACQAVERKLAEGH